MAGLPVYDQGASDLCYAYSNSQLIDAWRRSHGVPDGPLTSAVANGIEMNGENGGNVMPSYGIFREHGACSAGSIDAFIATAAPGKGVANPYRMFERASAAACPDRTEAQERNACGLARACGSRIDLTAMPSMETQLNREGGMEDVRRAIDASLDAGQPAAMIYCMSALRDRNFRYFDDNNRPGVCRDGKHASVIVGRRRVQGPGGRPRCEYLVRNSFGPCSNVEGTNYGSRCENGQFWMDVVHNAYQVFWIARGGADGARPQSSTAARP